MNGNEFNRAPDAPLFKITAPWGQWKVGDFDRVSMWLKIWAPMSKGKAFRIEQISA